MRSKEYLQQAFNIEKKIKLDMQKLEAAKAALHGRAVTYDPVGAKPSVKRNSIEDSMIRFLDYEDHINSEIDRLTEIRSEIENEISSLSDDTLREVLTRRYLMYQKWDVIAEEMNYGERYVYKLHSKALKTLCGDKAS